MIVGLVGAAGSGKSTAAEYLASEYGFRRARFAGPLKSMLAGYLTHMGFSDEEIDRRIEGDLKEEPLEEFSGRTPRYVMQTLGTEWGRGFIAPDFWINSWRAHVVRLMSREGVTRVAVEDCRFPNEAQAIRGAGGVLLKINRPGPFIIPTSSHASEQQPIEPDMQIYNDGPPSILHARLDGIMDRLMAHRLSCRAA